MGIMDPQELLNRLREWANGDDNGMSASDAMEAFQELDKWLSNGGFLPKPWQWTTDDRKIV